MSRTNKNSPLTCLNVHWFCIKMIPLITLLSVFIFKYFPSSMPLMVEECKFSTLNFFQVQDGIPSSLRFFSIWEVSVFFHEGICLPPHPLHVTQSSTKALLVMQRCRVWGQAELCQTAEEDFVQTCWRHLLRKTHIGIFHKDWWLA